MGPFCLHRATEIEDGSSNGKRNSSLCSEKFLAVLGMTIDTLNDERSQFSI
jgi:hypothetical protein